MQFVISLDSPGGAHVLHVPLCSFAHCEGDVSPDPQKYISLMYSPELEPAISFLRHTRCHHRSHTQQAVGFDASGRGLGAKTSLYTPELNRILVRALSTPIFSLL